MPITVTKTAYTFDELSEEAKERARDWYRSINHEFEDLSERNYDDFVEVARCLGIEFDSKEVGRMRDGTKIYGPAIYWSGFYSQGDGACFEGTWRYRGDSCAAIRNYAPQDEELHRIADELARIHAGEVLAGRAPPATASIQHRGHYYHEHSMDIDVYDDAEDDLGDVPAEALNRRNEIVELMRDFARWMYHRLEADHDYLNSDEAVDEAIEANEYLFDEEGDRHAYA